MSARDDYPVVAAMAADERHSSQYADALNEIDDLRALVADLEQIAHDLTYGSTT